MAKADGFVTDDEIRAFQEFFKFDADDAAKVRMVFDLAKQDVTGFDHYADQVARIFADEPIVLEDVIDCLLYIALADGQAHPREMEMLEQAAVRMQLKPGAWRRLKAAHLGQDHDDPYLILGVDHAADDSAVRARYRDLMRENHPDALIARACRRRFSRSQRTARPRSTRPMRKSFQKEAVNQGAACAIFSLNPSFLDWGLEQPLRLDWAAKLRVSCPEVVCVLWAI